MSDSTKTTQEINQVMLQAILELQKIINPEQAQKKDFLPTLQCFLLGVLSNAADLVELNLPGAAPLLYADMEAAAKLGGLRAIRKMQLKNKGLHKLPLPLRTPEMLLRGVEALLANLINQKFNNSHDILDSFSEHIHVALDQLVSPTRH